MSERYTRLFSLPENLYVEGSPVLIAAGALLRDNQTGGVLAQLKFQSLSERRIQAVKVALRAFDVTGAELEGVPEQQYLDLNVPRGDSFGQKTAIPLPNAVTRSFCCACSSVVFADGSVWTAPENAAWEPVKQPTPLQDALGDLAEQYRRDTFAGAQYAPADDRDLWVCACGTVNRRTEAQCVRCGSERDALFAAADATLLRERAQEFSAQQAKEAAERKAAAEKEAAEEKERMAAVKKRLIIAGSAAAVLIAAILVLTQVILPSCKYHAALKLMKNGSYDEAIAAFEALEDYKDSAAQAEACKKEPAYQNAVSLENGGKFVQAAIAFGKLSGYSDAEERSFSLWNGIVQEEPLSGGSIYSLGLKANSTVIAVGNNDYDQCNVSGWTDIEAISAGSSHSLGLKADSTVVAVGLNTYGQCNVSDWIDIVAISAGSNHSLGLKADGTVVAVGLNSFGQCDVSGWTDIVAVSAGVYHSLGLRADGTVVVVGPNTYGQRNVSNWIDIAAISAGYSHSLGLKGDGTVVAVGLNNSGQCDVSDWTDIVAISAGSTHSLGLKGDGTVVATGDNEDGQCDVSGWTGIVAISAGDSYSLGLKADGTVVATGNNKYGQCDVSGWTDIRLPD